MGQLEAREKQEALFWKQKARVKWVQEGERNTNFFHNSVVHNRNSSRIQRLKTRDGNRVEKRWDIEAELTQHFSEILREDGGDRGQDIEQITSLIPRLVTGENNEMLIKPIGMWEVEEAVNQMALGNALALMASQPTSSIYSRILSRRMCSTLWRSPRLRKGSLNPSMLPSSPLFPKRWGRIPSINLDQQHYAMSYTKSFPKSLLTSSNLSSRCSSVWNRLVSWKVGRSCMG